MTLYRDPSNREELSKVVLQAAELARAKLALIPFAKQENIDFEEYYRDWEITWWYECRENKSFYRCTIERTLYNEKCVASNQEELVSVFVDEAIRNYAYDYEFHNRHHYISSSRQIDTIKEFCYHFLDGRKCYEDYYDDYVTVAMDLLCEYGELCEKIISSNTEDEAVTKALNYIIKKEYSDYPYGGLNSWRDGLFKAHEKMKILAEAYPVQCKRFYYLEKFFESAMKNLDD